MTVDPGNVVGNLLYTSLVIVETGGLKSEPCTKARVPEMVMGGRTVLTVKILFLLVILNSWTVAAVG